MTIDEPDSNQDTMIVMNEAESSILVHSKPEGNP